MKIFSSLKLGRRNAPPRQRLRKQLNDASHYRSNLSLLALTKQRHGQTDTQGQTKTFRKKKGR
ncbi:hypothetical protein B7P43_G14738 [Cryptotermes secundus]|uniref:Uncharacterized protein n=1 Tax=Cryptotermes secundus TaxID=105785 RepID=A0A2J7R6Y6_9NEOP|nr:hypothetical protein B7P43_G14738 [Cryptotermes secundus]